jgi:pyruvate dehydrogenase E2 component (dihydrolipoamide acetyltransferase)
VAINILMPALSSTMTEGKLARWLKQPGDFVAAGDMIAEIETDKAIVEVAATEEGILDEIRTPEGSERVPVNAVIATLLAPSESLKATATSDPEANSLRAHAPRPRLTETPRAVELAPGGNESRADGVARVFASPLAKRIAKQRGIELTGKRGTGPGGRIVKADVEGPGQAAAGPAAAGPAATAAVPPQSAREVEPRRWADLVGQSYELRPHSNIRNAIARRMGESKRNIPHYYLTLDCRIDALLDLQTRYNASSDVVSADKVSVNDFVIRASALALRMVPQANVSWSEEGVLSYRDVDVAVAVATPDGLITPVVHQADGKSLRQISAEMRDLAGRAREGKLKPQEYQGGTFSISNLGMFGIREFAAIINPPQACILAVGSGEQRAVVNDGALAVATVMSCTLSVDHRAIDGALGAQYLSAFKVLIEDPYRLLQ